ncbi:SRPBCC domain-containing protein [Hellea sp.]|nr:SRPBCC domain-containing protein [Hellea sp.]
MSAFYPPSAEIEINATAEQVWSVLLNGEKYPEWNSFILSVDGNLLAENTSIPLEVRLGERIVKPRMRVVLVEPQDGGRPIARWVHRFDSRLARLGWLTSERHHEIHPIGEGATSLYKTWEPFGGWMSRFVPYQKIDEGFKVQAQELKTRVEGLQGL